MLNRPDPEPRLLAEIIPEAMERIARRSFLAESPDTIDGPSNAERLGVAPEASGEFRGSALLPTARPQDPTLGGGIGSVPPSLNRASVPVNPGGRDAARPSRLDWIDVAGQAFTDMLRAHQAGDFRKAEAYRKGIRSRFRWSCVPIGEGR